MPKKVRPREIGYCFTSVSLDTQEESHNLPQTKSLRTYSDYCSPTVCVTCGWVGRDDAILPEPTSSHATCLKTRRLPPVGCTLCWAATCVASSTPKNMLPRSS